MAGLAAVAARAAPPGQYGHPRLHRHGSTRRASLPTALGQERLERRTICAGLLTAGVERLDQDYETWGTHRRKNAKRLTFWLSFRAARAVQLLEERTVSDVLLLGVATWDLV